MKQKSEGGNLQRRTQERGKRKEKESESYFERKIF